MARTDDYKQAREMAAEKLSQLDFDHLREKSGYLSSEPGVLEVPFLNRHYRVRYPAFAFYTTEEDRAAIPLQEQVLILHYLAAPAAPQPAGRWVAYREIPGAGFYFSAFAKRAIDPLKRVFGRDTASLDRAAAVLGGRRLPETGDAGYAFKPLPKVPLQLILWEGDDEFAPEANILFDRTVGEILSPEDIAWLAGMLVYRLIALSR